jgi:hypothetical protein
MHIGVDYTEQVQWMFGGTQAPSYEDANIVVIETSPGAFSYAPYLLFLNLSLCEVLVVH